MNLRIFSLMIASAIGVATHAEPALAQVAPDALEIARYTGLHLIAATSPRLTSWWRARPT